MSINSNSKIFNSRAIEFYSMERGRGNTRGSMFRWNKNTGYNFLSIHSQFKSLSYRSARSLSNHNRHLFPSDNTIDISKTAPFKELSNICSTFVTCTISHYAQVQIHFYTRIMLSLSFTHTFFSLPLGWEETGGGWNIRLQYLLCIFSRDHVMSPIICSMLGK